MSSDMESGNTEEFIRSAIIRKTEELVQADVDSRVRRFTRRDAYLLAWGAVYIFVGLLLILGTGRVIGSSIFGGMFISAGAISLTATGVRANTLDALAFTTLSGVAAARGVWSVLVDRPALGGDGTITTLSFLAAALWLGVALAQVIVAGWPAPRGDSDASLFWRRR